MKKQFWFTPQEIDLLITALEVAEPSPNRADYDGSKHGDLARYQAARFTTRRIKEMKERLMVQIDPPAQPTSRSSTEK